MKFLSAIGLLFVAIGIYVLFLAAKGAWENINREGKE